MTLPARPRPPASRSADLFGYIRIFSKDRSATVATCGPLLFIRIFVADPQQLFLVSHMQIPIARRIDYPRPDRDRARSRDARARRNPPDK